MDKGSKELNKLLEDFETMSVEEYNELYKNTDKHFEKIMLPNEWLESALKSADEKGFISLGNNRLIHKDILIKSVKDRNYNI